MSLPFLMRNLRQGLEENQLHSMEVIQVQDPLMLILNGSEIAHHQAPPLKLSQEKAHRFPFTHKTQPPLLKVTLLFFNKFAHLFNLQALAPLLKI